MALKRPAVATAVLALLGVILSIDLVYTHWQLAHGLPTACTISTTVDCGPVLTSDYAYIFGVPIAWFALATYIGLAAAALVVWRLPSTRRRQQVASALFMAAVAAVGFSIYLASIAFFVLGTVCPFCAGLYAINLGLLVATARLASAAQALTRDHQAWQARARLIGAGAVAALVLLIGTLVWKVGAASIEGQSVDEICKRNADFCEKYRALPVVALDVPEGHVKGSASPTVTIVEFSDFECGHCLKAYQSLKDVLPRLGKDVQVRFHHFPLDSACNPDVPAGAGHKYACLAAMASECAAQQQKFWQYHDLLFQHQPVFDRDSLLGYAENAGLDRVQFLSCLDSDAARQAVQRDIAAGRALHIESTPTLYFNGRAFRGAPDAQMLGDAIELERAAKPS